MKGLSKKQREILDFIQLFIERNHFSPSYREIADQFSYRSVTTIARHLAVLKRKGAITYEANGSRSISVVQESEKPRSSFQQTLPFIGCLDAQGRIKLFSETQQLAVPSSLAPNQSKTYLLRVESKLFNEELIAEGDLLIIEARHQAYSGEPILGIINEQDIIIKRFYPEGDDVRLVGVYADHHPIILGAEDLAIHGVLIGLLRESFIRDRSHHHQEQEDLLHPAHP